MAYDDSNAPFYNHTPIPRRRYGATITGSTDVKLWQRLMRVWYGLTPCRGDAWQDWARCPHVVGSGPGPVRLPVACRDGRCEWALKRHSSRVIPHPRAWRDSSDRVVVTLEPWGNPFDVVDEHSHLIDDLEAIGIAVMFEGRSPYGASYLLGLTRVDNGEV